MGLGRVPGPSRCRIRPRRSPERKPEACRRSTLGLTGSSPRVRASQRGCSTTARSPSGERRPSASRRVMAPLLRPVATSATSLALLARSLGWRRRRGRTQNDARVCGEPAARWFLFTQESLATVHRR
jgi:hypothetical protein